MSLTLLAQARSVATQEQYQFAVVLAQAACELRTEDAIIELMRHRKVDYLTDPLLGFVRTTSFDDHRLRNVFIALTGDDPSKAVWWSDWKESRDLRHRVAHEGGTVTQGQAMKCIDVADKYVEHLTSVVEKARTV